MEKDVKDILTKLYKGHFFVKFCLLLLADREVGVKLKRNSGNKKPPVLAEFVIQIHCAPGGIRTPNNGSEDRCDIHFTTGAVRGLYTNCQIKKKVYNTPRYQFISCGYGLVVEHVLAKDETGVRFSLPAPQ